MFTPSRQDVRLFFFQIWQKLQKKEALSSSEQIASTIVIAHPEYHEILNQADRYLEHEWTPEKGQTNPFLHMSLHMAIHEQIQIDQPFGIRDLYQSLCLKYQDEHHAQHIILDALGEVLWQAQSTGSIPDNQLYLNLIRQKLGIHTSIAIEASRPLGMPNTHKSN